MSGTLTHSPAVILARLLIGQGLGTAPDGTDTSWQVFETSEPDRPDECLTVFDTAGRDHGRTSPDGLRHEHEGVQVRVRSRTHDAGWAKAQAVALALDAVNHAVASVGASSYTVVAAVRTAPVLSLGADPASRRRLFTVNALLALTAL